MAHGFEHVNKSINVCRSNSTVSLTEMEYHRFTKVLHYFAERYVQGAGRNMIKYSFLICCFFLQAFAQHHTPSKLSATSLKVQRAYQSLMSDRQSIHLQELYVRSFPNDYNTFARVFDPPDFGELYDSSYEYIFILDSIAEHHPIEVCNKIISLAKDGERYLKQSGFIADAPAELQMITISFAVKYPDLFIKSMNRLSATQKDSLATFLADVENHAAYPEYEQFISILKDKEQSELQGLFIRAKKARMKYRHHDE